MFDKDAIDKMFSKPDFKPPRTIDKNNRTSFDRQMAGKVTDRSIEKVRACIAEHGPISEVDLLTRKVVCRYPTLKAVKVLLEREVITEYKDVVFGKEVKIYRLAK